jgi:hypothetical protein
LSAGVCGHTLLTFLSAPPVISPSRYIRFRLGALVLLALPAVVHAATTEVASAGVTPAPLPALPTWSVSTAVESAYGFKDNLLLSSSAEERSALARGVAEVLLFRLPTGAWDYSLFAQAEGTHFFSGRTVENEAKGWLQTELGLRAGDGWKLSLPLTGYYYDQVFDVSDTEVERLVAELKVAGVMAGPRVRWTFRSDFWLEAQGVVERKRYADEVNDGRVGATAIRAGWRLGERVELRAAGHRRWRDFDSRLQYSAAGRELAGAPLKIQEDEKEVRLDLKWDRAGQWQTSTRAGLRHYRDNGSGYFNYREQRVDHEVEWSGTLWRVRGRGEIRRVEFDVQTVGLGIAPPARIKDEYNLEGRVERKLTDRWTIFAALTWERSRSNDRVASYRVNEGLLGVRWSWEK